MEKVKQILRLAILAQDGYTLVELIVVMGIMAIVSLVIFINLGSFREDQSLRQTSSQIQTNLRVVQANASSNVKCQDNPAKSWLGKFSKTNVSGQFKYKLEIICQYDSASGVLLEGCNRVGTTVSCIKSTYTLDKNIVIPTIISKNCNSDTLNDPVTISFSPLSSKPKFVFEGSQVGCSMGTSLSIDLKNTASPEILKVLVVDQGGSIYEQKTTN